jgi:alpha-aminoadipic semialdehyde synthase
MTLDVRTHPTELSKLVSQADVVVSLLPASMHPRVAQECITHQTHLVTASYVSPEMQALHTEAQMSRVLLLNEMGLDPGLDHMSAMKIIHDIQDRGGQVTHFSSVCGGLPAPAYADNPFQYKFSWSPVGVLRASQQNAQYRDQDRLIRIQGCDLLASAQSFTDIWPAVPPLEVLPNRDALHYESLYGIEGASTLFRGTLRYQGFCHLLHTLQQMGLLSEDVRPGQDSWEALLLYLAETNGFHSVRDWVRACSLGKPHEARRAMEALEWLGLLDSSSGDRLRLHGTTIVDALCRRMQEKLQYGPDEYDMVVMHHTIVGKFPNNHHDDIDQQDGLEERHTSSLHLLGNSTMSAMSKTVGYTTAMGAELILEGHMMHNGGVVVPLHPHIYNLILNAMEKEGIYFQETVQKVQKYTPRARASG